MSVLNKSHRATIYKLYTEGESINTIINLTGATYKHTHDLVNDFIREEKLEIKRRKEDIVIEPEAIVYPSRDVVHPFVLITESEDVMIAYNKMINL